MPGYRGYRGRVGLFVGQVLVSKSETLTRVGGYTRWAKVFMQVENIFAIT